MGAPAACACQRGQAKCLARPCTGTRGRFPAPRGLTAPRLGGAAAELARCARSDSPRSRSAFARRSPQGAGKRPRVPVQGRARHLACPLWHAQEGEQQERRDAAQAVSRLRFSRYGSWAILRPLPLELLLLLQPDRRGSSFSSFRSRPLPGRSWRSRLFRR